MTNVWNEACVDKALCNRSKMKIVYTMLRESSSFCKSKNDQQNDLPKPFSHLESFPKLI